MADHPRGHPAAGPLLTGLLHDAAGRADGSTEPLVARYRRSRTDWYASTVGPLVVSDRDLAGTARIADRQGFDASNALEVCVVNTSGAGGLLALADRSSTGLRVVAVESALRDLDDPAGNAERVVAAAGELDDQLQVYVELPWAVHWERAVEVVEAAGLRAAIRADAGNDEGSLRLARQMSVLVEADLPFKIVGEVPSGLVGLFAALDHLIDEADPRAAADLLDRRSDPSVPHPDRSAEQSAESSDEQSDEKSRAGRDEGWDEARQARLRRRLTGVDSTSVEASVAELLALGLLTRP